MISSFEKNSLHELLKDFYKVVGIRISVFDDSFNLVTEYPDYPPELCRIIRSKPEGETACRACDCEAFERAKKLGKPHAYTCHAGLTETITPISLSGGIIGYALFAHMMPKEQRNKATEEIVRRCAAYCDAATARKAANKIKPQSNDKILASLRLLDAIASYMQISKMAYWKNENIPRQIDTFISENLKENLSSRELCKHFFISRTKLYNLSMQSFGMSITEYVTKKRIDKAKELLTDSNMTVAAVANEVGISDYNYFGKLFKKHLGTPPPRTYQKGK